MGRPRKVLVMPEGYLYEAVRDWYDNDPAKCWTKKGKYNAKNERQRLMDKMQILINRDYALLLDKYRWEPQERMLSHHARYYIEFFYQRNT